MRICSFDLFDTLLTRLVAHPYDLFLELGERLKEQGILQLPPEHFVRSRVDAEIAARKKIPHGEVSLGEIHQELRSQLGWDQPTSLLAQSLELALEKENIRIVPCAAALLKEARSDCERICFISDMYLPSAFLREILESGGLFLPGDYLVVSQEAKACKASGELYDLVRKSHGSCSGWTHHGDNLHSDIKMASARGIQAVHFCRCELTRYEQVFRPLEQTALPLWRSKWAGAMRYSRLCNPNSGNKEVIWDSSTQVVGPLLFAFVFWCLEQARQLGLQRLYFVSRDGQILKTIADEVNLAWGYGLDIRYLYGGRLPWLTAAITELDEKVKRWVTAPTEPMSVITCLRRLGLTPAEVQPILEQGGFSSTTWENILTLPEREALWSLCQNTEIKTRALAAAQNNRQLALDYLRQEGFLDPAPSALVDIGWYGNLQRSLEQLLLVAGQGKKLQGFYYGLFPDQVRPEDRARFLDFWGKFNSPENLRRRNITFLEMFTAATHGTVLGYVRTAVDPQGERIDPVLQEDENRVGLEWGVQTVHDGVLHFVRVLLGAIPKPQFSPGDLFPLVRAAYDQFYFNPTPAEARAWGSFPLNTGPLEIHDACVMPELKEWEVIRALLDHRRRPTSWWMEGARATRFSPALQLYLLARRLRWKLNSPA